MKRLFGRYGLLLSLLCLWQVLSVLQVLPGYKTPSPIQVLIGFKELLTQGLPPGYLLHNHCLQSLYRVFAGFIVAAILAIPLGIIMGWSVPLREAITPLIEVMRPVPPLAWIPLAILWFGIGFKSAVFIIFLGCFFPIILSTISGVLSIDSILIDASKTLGAKKKEIFFKVLAPGSLPSMLTGLRIGLGIGWMTLVAAEFTGVKSGYGLGYMIMTARDIQRPDEVIAGMAIIGLIGYLLDLLLRRIESRLLIWR
jgi:ABC-type nitrate/sulfonate/bicarbonate transport system permease component